MKRSVTAAVDDIRGVFVADKGESCFDLCSLESGHLIRSFGFRTREVECRLPLQVTFANEGRYIVGGSDHGVAYVYDRKTAQMFDILHHALDDETLVQTVSVSLFLPFEGLALTNVRHTITVGRTMSLLRRQVEADIHISPSGSVSTKQGLSLNSRRRKRDTLAAPRCGPSCADSRNSSLL